MVVVVEGAPETEGVVVIDVIRAVIVVGGSAFPRDPTAGKNPCVDKVGFLCLDWLLLVTKIMTGFCLFMTGFCLVPPKAACVKVKLLVTR